MNTDCATSVLGRSDLETSRIGSWVASPLPLSAFVAPERQRSRVVNLIGTVAETLESIWTTVVSGSREIEDNTALAAPVDAMGTSTSGESPNARNAASLDLAQRVIRQITASQPGRCWRFRHLQRATPAKLACSGVKKSCWVYLNPARCWAVLQPTDEALGADRLPWNTLIYESAGQLQGLVADLEGQVLINELADYQPCSISEWSRLSSLANASQLTALVQRLACCGLVALV